MIIILVDLPLAEFDVGLITVDMSINVTYPNLKPHLHELAELIAKELEIDSSQVYKNVCNFLVVLVMRVDLFSRD
jgi:2C-methyl-D-erythritol 2,4-cyclodiphosphate synthase